MKNIAFADVAVKDLALEAQVSQWFTGDSLGLTPWRAVLASVYARIIRGGCVFRKVTNAFQWRWSRKGAR